MAQATPACIESFMSEYGWSFVRCPQSDCAWESGWEGSKGAMFPLRLAFSPTALTLTVRPLGRVPAAADDCPEFARELLELNQACVLAKVGVVENDLVLSLAMLTEGLTYAVFEQGLGVLAYYAEVMAERLSCLCERYGAEWPKNLHV